MATYRRSSRRRSPPFGLRAARHFRDEVSDGRGVYPEALEEFSIASEIPDEADREKINEIIFKELVKGVFPEASRLYFNEVAGKFKARGCDAVVLGCTEIPLIVRPDDTPLPTLDSTRLLARAALRRAQGQ